MRYRQLKRLIKKYDILAEYWAMLLWAKRHNPSDVLFWRSIVAQIIKDLRYQEGLYYEIL